MTIRMPLLRSLWKHLLSNDTSPASTDTRNSERGILPFARRSSAGIRSRSLGDAIVPISLSFSARRVLTASFPVTGHHITADAATQVKRRGRRGRDTPGPCGRQDVASAGRPVGVVAGQHRAASAIWRFRSMPRRRTSPPLGDVALQNQGNRNSITYASQSCLKASISSRPRMALSV